MFEANFTSSFFLTYIKRSKDFSSTKYFYYIKYMESKTPQQNKKMHRCNNSKIHVPILK